jgi:hypothetical protein
MQAALKPAGREKWNATFLKADTYWDCVQHGEVWVGFPWVRGPVCHRGQFCLICYFCFLKKKKKEKTIKKEGKMARGFS